MPAALVVETTRAASIETLAPVWAVVVDRTGSVVAAYGEEVETHPFPPRSTIKPLQAVPLVASGAADAGGVTTQELALACASHNGEQGHVDAVAAWLARLGLGDADLQCAPSLPYAREVADALVAAGGHADRLRHNCSGKHTGLLTVGLHLGADPAGYLALAGPVQQAALAAIESRCGLRLDPDLIGLDGCSAPAVAMPLPALGRGLATLLGDPDGTRLLDAMAAHPWEVAGTGRFDTEVSVLTGGRVVAKIGADGGHVALDREQGLIVVTKSLAGTGVPAQVALTALLHRHAALSDDESAALAVPPLTDGAGHRSGEVRLRG